ncbi:hypothetical protein EON81_11435 [bacterium]|nr:MAG: hypothetical protein EON81_11435 [bacterium]
MIALLLSAIAAGPAEDPRLAAPAKISVVREPITEALATLEKGKGCRLEVASALHSRQIALHTEKEPLGQTLERIAEVMEAKWTETPAGWRLDPVPERVVELAAYLKLRDDLLVSEARATLEGMAKIAERPFPEVYAEGEKARKAGAAEEDPKKAEPLFARWRELGSGNYLSYLTGALYASLGQEERSRFWKGEMFVGSTAAGKGGHALPSGSENWGDQSSEVFLANRGDTRIFSRFHPVLHQFQERILREGLSGHRVIMSVPYIESPALKKHPFSVRQTAWDQRKLFSSAWAKPAAKLDPPGKSPWQRGYWAKADVLARLHARTGIPVVAMVDRSAWPIAETDRDLRRSQYGTPPPAGTVGAALAAFAEIGEMHLHESSGFLLSRSSRWAEQTLASPPEAAVRSFESLERPTLNDCAVLALGLTDRQAYAMGQPDQIVCRNDATPLAATALEALRLWGILSPAQRSALLGGRALQATALSPSQSRQLEGALIGAVLNNSEVPDVMRRLFDGVDQDALKGLSLWASAQPVQESHVMPPRTSSQEYKLDLAMKPGLVLILGPSRTEGIEIRFATPPSP